MNPHRWLGCSVLTLLSLSAVLSGQVRGESSAGAATGQVTTRSGLVYEIVKKGTGTIAKSGQTVRIHETLSLPDSRVIFSSREKNEPVTFVLGGNQVIPGVDEGVTGMRVGERRKLLVPPSLDGRKFDPAFIPPDTIRHYDVELVECEGNVNR
jgi:FKBP-type peptidyl-prolyl cis-trans isomerase